MDPEPLVDASEEPGTYLINRASESQKLQKNELSSGTWRIVFFPKPGVGAVKPVICSGLQFHDL